MRKKVILLVLVLVSILLSIFTVYSQQTGCCTDPYGFTCEVMPAGPQCPVEYFYAGQDCSAISECQPYPAGCCIDTCSDAIFQAQCPDRTQFRPGPCPIQSECQRGCCVCDQNLLDPTDNVCFPLQPDQPLLTASECRAQCEQLQGYSMILHDPTMDYAECANQCQAVIAIPANISGYVRDLAGNAISQAKVEAVGITTFTNTNGFYTLSNVPTGTITVKASKAGYSTEQETIETESGQAYTIDFNLSVSATGTISGTITDQETGQPIQGATVSISGPTLASTTTNADGEYEITLLPLGTYNVKASKAGYTDSTAITTPTQVQPAQTVNLQLTPIPKAVVQGVVKDELGNPIPYAKIFVNGEIKAYSKPVSGTYSIELPAAPEGTAYSMYVTRAGYTPSDPVDIILVQSEIRQLDFTLATVLCAYPEARPVPGITVEHIPGVKAVQLRWQLPGACNNIAGYILMRQHYIGNQLQSETEAAFMTVTQEEHPTEFIDYNVSWSTTYQYTIRAVYSDQIFRNSTPTSSDKITLGNKTCEKKYKEEFNRFIEFCIGPYRRRTCDEENQVIKAPAAYGNPSDCSDISPDTYCSGPDFLGYTKCRNAGICSPVSQEAIPFGFYFDETTCLGLTNENYCYYDYSATIVDICKPCSQETTCFDYISEKACTTDNCDAANLSSCKWMDTFYASLGKGICYQENYTGSDYCYKCSETYTIFENYECTQELCSKLGRCYADERNANCLSCTNVTRCKDLKTKEQCIGKENQSIEIIPPACGETIIWSMDSCDLGTCKWNSITQTCYKDANDDNIPDCDIFPGDFRQPCEEDNTPPATTTIKKFYLAGEDTVIDFSTDLDAELFYYCLDHDNTCCPEDTIYVYDGEVSLIPSEVVGFKDLYNIYGSISPYYIRFFSADNSLNQEELKNISFYIDLAPPEISFNYSVVPHLELTPVISDLNINLTLNEVATCSDALTYVPTGLTQNKLQDEAGDFFILNYTNLADGLYVYTINCTDSFGNTVEEKIEPLIIDSYRFIEVIYPEGAIKQTSITFQITTQDESICDLYRQGEFFDEFATTDFLTHSSSTHVLPTNTYYPYFEARCIDLTTQEMIDTAPIVFTIDQLAPITTVDISNHLEYTFNKTEWKVGLKGTISIDLSCHDALTGSFGCGPEDTRYCIASNATATCVPDTPGNSLSITNDTRICYFSTDKGGNTELVKCGTIVIGEFFGIKLIRPPYNVSNTPVFDVEIEVDRPSESCKFAAADFVYSELISLQNQFIKLTPLRFIYYGFSFDTPYPMNIKCEDTKGKINEEPVVYVLEVDETAPVITDAFANPDPVLQGAMVTLNAITDDKTICKFDKTQQLYELMNGKFTGWNDKSFSWTHSVQIQLTAQDDNKTHNYTVICENRAGNLSQAEVIEFFVDFSAAGSIIRTLPKGSLTETDVNLTVITNKDAICEYQEGATWLSFSMTGGLTHIEPKTGLIEDSYTYPVRCRFIQSNDLRSSSIKFIIDQTPPVMENIEDYNFTCGTTIQPTFEANDTSPIDYYNYSLYEFGTNDIIIDWTTTTSDNPRLRDLNITPGNTYYFRVKAVDVAGNEGSEISSNGFISRDETDAVCVNDNTPPSVTISTSTKTTGVEVTLTCSDANGCDGKYYSTSIPPTECIVYNATNNTYTSPVILPQTSYFCYRAFDSVGNAATGLQLITITDSDLDGVPDNLDQCPGTPAGATVDDSGCSPEQLDSDGDGMPDYWELRYDLNPNDPADRDEDPDGDGYTNYEEYLQGTDPTVPDIFDSDGDGIPDDQDKCPFTQAGETVDSDGCAESQKDSDGDGIDDAWENRAGLDPFDPTDANQDSDGDGLTNKEEYQYWKDTGRYIDPKNPDTDGDGFTDKEEIDEGFDPTNPNSHPKRLRLFPLILLIIGLLLIFSGSGYTIYTKYQEKKKQKPPVRPYALPTAAPARPVPAPKREVPAKPAAPPKPIISPEEMRRRAILERLRQSKERKSKRREKYFAAFGPGKVTKPAPKPAPAARPEVKPFIKPSIKPKVAVPLIIPTKPAKPVPTPKEFERLAEITKEHLAKKKIPAEARPEFEKLSRLLEKRKEAKHPPTEKEKKIAKDIFTHLERLTTKAKPAVVKIETSKAFEKLAKITKAPAKPEEKAAPKKPSPKPTPPTPAKKPAVTKKPVKPTLKKKPKIHCRVCGYEWTPRVENPKQCPNCKSTYWRTGKPPLKKSSAKKTTPAKRKDVFSSLEKSTKGGAKKTKK